VKRAVLFAGALACGSSARDVIDLHVDLPYALHVEHRALAAAQASPERLAPGHVRGIVTPLFVPGAYEMKPAEVRAEYEATYRDLRAALPIGAETYLAFEGADGFADDASAIDAWMTRGACLVGLVHDHGNALGGSSQDPSPAERARGLTEAGKKLAARVVAHGGLLDAAHASDAAFDDLLQIARDAGVPLVDSHTGLRALRDTMRNLDDARLRALAATGGVAGISMHGGHVGKIPGEHPTLADVADAIAHAVLVAGIDHVAIGSDFDGGIDAPDGSNGESVLPRLREALGTRGLSTRAIDVMFSHNADRVFAFARAHGCTPGAR
jgi:membrane dipeptidase